MSDQINDCSFYFYFICANWNIVVKIVDIVIMAQDLIALCNFFIQLIYRDNMYIIPYLLCDICRHFASAMLHFASLISHNLRCIPAYAHQIPTGFFQSLLNYHRDNLYIIS